MRHIRPLQSVIKVVFALALLVACSKDKTATPEVKEPVIEPPVEENLTISDFNPKSERAGASVMILGTAFGSDLSAVHIKFGNSAAVNPTVVSNSSITVKVPADATSGQIELVVKKQKVTTSVNFTVTKTPSPVPVISDFTPNTAKVGDRITINGETFGTSADFVSVKFGGSTAKKPVSVTDNQIVVDVPTDAKTGKIELVINGGTPVISKEELVIVVTPLKITSFTPATALTGETLTINGTGFGTDTNFVSISFGGAPGVKPKSITPSKMTVNVPANAKNGKIAVTVNGGTPVNSTELFTLKIIPVTVTGLSINHAKIGQEIIIYGTAFGTNPDLVKISFGGSAPIHPAKVSAKELTVIVPANTKNGKVSVSVNNGSPVENSTAFWLEVSVTGFLPKTAARGDTIKITGAEFGTVANNVYIDFSTSSGIPTKPYKVTPTELWVVVPADARNGSIEVRVADFGVYEGERTDWTKENFTFIPTLMLNTITPNAARAGWQVVIHGSFNDASLQSLGFSFGGSSVVHPTAINGFDATVTVPADAKSGKITASRTGYKPYNVSILSFTLIPPPKPLVAGSWTQRLNLKKISSTGAFAFSVGKKGYVGGGTDEQEETVWEYDPSNDTWTQKANFGGGGRGFAAAFSVGSKGYVTTGLSASGNTPQNDLWEFDPAANTWVQKASFAGAARAYAVGFSIGNKGYVGTGKGNGTNYYDDFYEYSPSANKWTKIASIPGARCEAFSFSANNKGYVGNGYATAKYQDMYLYDPATNAWTAKAAIPNFTKNAGHTSFNAKGKGYVGFGYNTEQGGVKTGTNEFFEYSPAGNSWKKLPDVDDFGHLRGVGFSIDDVGYIGMGVSFLGSANGVEGQFYAYKPQ